MLLLFKFSPIFAQPTTCTCVPYKAGDGFSGGPTTLSAFMANTPVNGVTFNPSFFPLNTFPVGIATNCILVKGTFTIDVAAPNNVDIFANGANLRMDPGAKIVVNPGIKFKISGTTISNCSNLWDGITLLSGATADFTNCTVAGAKNAIFSTNSANLHLTSNLFSNNYEAIHIQNSTLNAELVGNTFQSLSLPTGAPDNNTKGVYLQGVNGFNFSTGSNNFKNMNYGYYLDGGSDIDIWNENFEILGVAVLLYTTKNARFFYNTILETVNQGFFCNGTEGLLEIEENSIATKAECVFSNFHHLGDAGFRVSNNSLLKSLTSDCIKITRTTYNGLLSITGNYSVFPATQGSAFGTIAYGINLNRCNTGDGVNNGIGVNFNNITLSNNGPGKTGGIYINNSHTFGTSYALCGINNINGSTLLNRNIYGIYVANSPGFTLSENNVQGQNTSGSNTIPQAIRIENSPKTTLICNTVNKTNIGLGFYLNNESSIVSKSELGKHFYGIFYEIGSKTGPQDLQGNNWLNAQTLADGRFTGDMFAAFLSKYKISLSHLHPNPIFQVTQGVTSDWVTFVEDVEPFCKPVRDTSKVTKEAISEVNWYAIKPNEDESEKVVHWEAQRNLYEKLFTHPNLYENDIEVKNWFDIAKIGLIDQFYQVNALINKSMTIPDEFAGEYSSQNLALSNKVKERYLKNQQLEMASIAEYAVFSQELAQLSNEIDALILEISNLEDKIWSFQKDLIESAKSLNQNLTVDEITFLFNEKSMNALYLNALSNQVFSNEAIEKINITASQCPLYGGRGVYLARSLQTGSTRDYSETDECGGGLAVPFESTTERGESVDFATIYPNPATDILHVSFKPTTQKSTLKIFDLLGRIVLETLISVNTNNVDLNVKSIPNGLYQLVLKEGNTNRISQKITILH
jgi:Secretion system C-terminal sorting domain